MIWQAGYLSLAKLLRGIRMTQTELCVHEKERERKKERERERKKEREKERKRKKEREREREGELVKLKRVDAKE